MVFMMAGQRAGWMAVNLVDSMVGQMDDCQAERMAVKKVGSRAVKRAVKRALQRADQRAVNGVDSMAG